VAVIQSCPGEEGERLSLVAPAPEDDEKPQEQGSVLLASAEPANGIGTGVRGARIVAVSGENTVVYLPGDEPALAVYDGKAVQIGRVPLPYPATRATPGATIVGDRAYWWSGSQLIALNSADFAPAWFFDGAIGPGTQMADRFLVPITGGIAVLDVETGAQVGFLRVPRPDLGANYVALAAVGDVIFEQRGDTLVALG
jgi:hypothetical protein